jgi:hypothetical protein
MAGKREAAVRDGRPTGTASMAKDLQREVLWRADDAKARMASPGSDNGVSGAVKFHAFRAKFFGKFGLASIIDQALVATGVAGAVASAGFAVIMISTDHSQPMFSGIEHLMLFAQPIHGRPAPILARGYEPATDNGIDYTATGSIPRSEQRRADKIGTTHVHAPPTEPIIMDYVLREAQMGVAVVQGNGAAYRIKPGNFLPGAGRVLSVEQREDTWVVVTTQGIISDHPSPSRAP